MDFALIHSPLVGPDTWEPVAAVLRAQGNEVSVPSLSASMRLGPPYWRAHAAAAAEAVLLQTAGRRVVLAGHSGAGPLLPHIGALLSGRVAGYVFVDAAWEKPPGRPEDLPLMPRGDAFLPAWATDSVLQSLIADRATRRRLLEGMPELPLAYFEEGIPPRTGWPDAPCAYLLCSDPYRDAAREARGRGWPVRELPGHHFLLVTDPEAVAGAIADLAAEAAMR